MVPYAKVVLDVILRDFIAFMNTLATHFQGLGSVVQFPATLYYKIAIFLVNGFKLTKEPG